MFATLAGLLYVAGFAPYIASVIRGKSKPSKATWLIWSVLDIITLVGMMSQGQVSATLVAGTCGSLTVAILALRKGEAGWSKVDRLAIAGAIAGLALWALTRSANVAIIITLAVMMIGAVPTLKSAWADPAAENKVAWALYATGCLFGLLAITEWSVAGAAQALVFTLIDGSITAVVFLRRRK